VNDLLQRQNLALYFCIIFGVMLLLGAFAKLLSKNFYTLHVFVRKFSILDLEFPDSSLQLTTYIKGIYLLPKELAQRSLRSLKTYLYLDFLFIPLVYGSLFLVCLLISNKFHFCGHYIFLFLAWLQLIPLICDAGKNFFLLKKITPDAKVSTDVIHRSYMALEKIKWLLALIATVFSLSSLFYFWVSGKYSAGSFRFMVIIIVEIIVFFILRKLFAKGSKIDLDRYQNIGN
jgi:hypothetical protein